MACYFLLGCFAGRAAGGVHWAAGTRRAVASPPGLRVQCDLRDVDSIVGDVFSVVIFHQPHEDWRMPQLLIVMDGEVNAVTNGVFVILMFYFLKSQH